MKVTLPATTSAPAGPATVAAADANARTISEAMRSICSPPSEAGSISGMRSPGSEMPAWGAVRDPDGMCPVSSHREDLKRSTAAFDEGDPLAVRRPRVGAVIELAATVVGQLHETRPVRADGVDVRRLARPAELRAGEDDPRSVGRPVDLRVRRAAGRWDHYVRVSPVDVDHVDARPVPTGVDQRDSLPVGRKGRVDVIPSQPDQSDPGAVGVGASETWAAEPDNPSAVG